MSEALVDKKSKIIKTETSPWKNFSVPKLSCLLLEKIIEKHLKNILFYRKNTIWENKIA